MNQINRLTPPGSRGMILNNQQQQQGAQQNMSNIGFNNQPQQIQPQQMRQNQNSSQQSINAPMSPMLSINQQQHVNRWSGPPPNQSQTPTQYHDQNINMHNVQITNELPQINGMF